MESKKTKVKKTEVEECKYTVRKLTRKDRVTLTGLITTFARSTDQKNLLALKPMGTEKDSPPDVPEMTNTTFKLLSDMVEHINEEIVPWFSELIDVPVQNFNDLPFDIEIDIISQLLERKGFVNFFLKALRLRSKIKDLVLRF